MTNVIRNNLRRYYESKGFSVNASVDGALCIFHENKPVSIKEVRDLLPKEYKRAVDFELGTKSRFEFVVILVAGELV
jgi:hypothetical protein